MRAEPLRRIQVVAQAQGYNAGTHYLTVFLKPGPCPLIPYGPDVFCHTKSVGTIH